MSELYNPFTLKGKVIFVTGASSGIGRAVAVECSRMGACLIVNGRNEVRLKETFDELDGEGHFMLPGDLTDKDTREEIVKSLKTIDGGVFCAGKGLTLPVQFSSYDKMRDIFDVNYFSTVELVSSLYKKKKFAKSGSVVLMDSIGGTGLFNKGNSIYGASKAALNAFMKYAAKEFAQRNVRVNCICPGMIETPLIHDGVLSDDQLAEDKKAYLDCRYGTPEEVAYAAVYLLSDAAKWVTGTDLVVDGGISI